MSADKTYDMFDPANPVLEYIREKSVREPDYLVRLREETAKHPAGRMQITPEQGALMRMLVKLLGAKTAIEIGVFTGYSAAVLAAALPEDGKLYACDHDIRHMDIQHRYWAEAGLLDKIDMRYELAKDAFLQWEIEGLGETVDMIFVDADKGSYISYYVQAMKLLRPGGLLIMDNVLWYGKVADPENSENLTVSVRKFNDFAAQQKDVEISTIPIGDGMTLIRKAV
ncbi:class I SAM-dependent methyltransferase [Curvivirga aplysinae]|uniref:class I SAM-dependent methyltransferase n=1 Tax=Curvivirga aplysinae TaxID=2529852 RepID=UPI001F2386CF|nr:class I SAM-dependent methyltransferase [Curvivirga aplysinae]